MFFDRAHHYDERWQSRSFSVCGIVGSFTAGRRVLHTRRLSVNASLCQVAPVVRVVLSTLNVVCSRVELRLRVYYCVSTNSTIMTFMY